MIKAEEARELSNRIKDYKNKLQNHLNKIEKILDIMPYLWEIGQYSIILLMKMIVNL